jgi:protease-4
MSGAAFAIALAASGCDESPPPSGAVGMLRSGLDSAGTGVVVELDLSRGLGELAGQVSFLSAPSAPSLAELLQALERAKTDRRTRGFFIRLGAADLNWAQAEELGRALSALPPELAVVCHGHGYSNKTLFFAARACDRLWLSPAGEVGTVGIAGQMVYIKRLLDRFHVKADFLHMGRYKSFAETFTEDGPTPAARESLAGVLGSIRGTWLDGLKAARPREKLEHAVEHGPWSPEAALRDQLIDAIGYVSEARDEARKLAQVDGVETSFGLESRRDAAEAISELIQAIAGTRRSTGGAEHVVVLTTAGGINMEAQGMLGGDGISAESLGKTLRRLREDDAVKAVVLRIDSPGGSALASDLIWHDLMLLRDKKPLIASLAEVAASGGYYMACAASRILAERTTILGSIGVVGGKIVLGPALDQFGVTGFTLPASNEPGAAERAAYLSPLTEWDEPTREAVRAQMEGIYELFLQRVAKGRNLPVDDIRKVAEGRIWSGVQGLEHHLVDELGGLSEAIAIAKREAGLDESAEVRIEGGPETLFDVLQLDDEEEDEPESIARALARLRALPPNPFDTLAEPLRPYAASFSPLLGKETVLTALPFAFEVK